jgi:hypothetical protein
MLRVLTLSAAIALCAFALSVAGLSAWRSWQYYHQQTNQKGSAENAAQESGDSTSSVLAVVPKENAEQAIARYNLWLMIFTGVLAIVSIIQIGFLIHANYLAEEAGRIAKNSADAATKAANANVDALGVSRAQMRAYLTVPETPVSTIRVEPDGRFSINFNITNNGQSLARAIEIAVTVGIRPFGGKDVYGPSSSAFPNDLGAGTSIERDFPVAALPEPLWSEFKKTGGAVLVTGTMNFTDIFDDVRSNNITLWVFYDAAKRDLSDFTPLIRPPAFYRRRE